MKKRMAKLPQSQILIILLNQISKILVKEIEKRADLVLHGGITEIGEDQVEKRKPTKDHQTTDHEVETENLTSLDVIDQGAIGVRNVTKILPNHQKVRKIKWRKEKSLRKKEIALIKSVLIEMTVIRTIRPSLTEDVEMIGQSPLTATTAVTIEETEIESEPEESIAVSVGTGDQETVALHLRDVEGIRETSEKEISQRRPRK